MLHNQPSLIHMESGSRGRGGGQLSEATSWDVGGSMAGTADG